MKKSTKVLIAGGIVIVGGLALWKLLSKPKVGVTGRGGISIPIGSMPASITEGVSYNSQVTITNTSVYTGTTVPAPYTFTEALKIYKGTVLPSDLTTNLLFSVLRPGVVIPAGATGPLSTSFIVPPTGYSGPAVAIAELWTTDGAVKLATSNVVTTTIVAGAVTPGGTVTL